MPLPRPQEQYDAVRQFLVLTPAQLSALTELQTSKRNAEAAIYEQMHQKQMELDALLRSGSNDAVSIGRLMVDINNLNLVDYPRIPSTLILPAAQEPASVNVVSEL
jgi:hypothetical protein